MGQRTKGVSFFNFDFIRNASKKVKSFFNYNFTSYSQLFVKYGMQVLAM